MGAWIEIKFYLTNCTYVEDVAPFMGAWIEIFDNEHYISQSKVAPFMGAWIEISKDSENRSKNGLSHPSWVRGLKSMSKAYLLKDVNVAPFMGAWIEIYLNKCKVVIIESRTLHGCVD